MNYPQGAEEHEFDFIFDKEGRDTDIYEVHLYRIANICGRSSVLDAYLFIVFISVIAYTWPE